MKHFICLLLVLVFFSACKSGAPIVNSKKTELKKEKLVKGDKRKTNRQAEKIVETATENLGAKYKYGGTTAAGFDCSGLVYHIFEQENIILPRNSYLQSLVGNVLDPNRDEVQKGDLIFFKTNNKSQINHVGIVIEATHIEIKFIHSSTSKGVIISSTKEPYYKKTFVQLNRIL